jgi:uncharacterized protein (TIGR02145 family)
LLSSPVAGATKDTLFVEKGQYGISGTGRAVYGSGARIANGGWIKIANANLGADQTKSLEDQLAYQPEASAPTNDKAYDPAVYGDWYQWGRAADGHENRRTPASGTYADLLDATDGLATEFLDPATGQVLDTYTDAYGKFIQCNVGTFDWRQYPEDDPDNTDLAPANDWTWGTPQAGITDLDPCKSELGSTWRVPTQAEWAQIQANNTWVWQDGGGAGTSGYQLKPGGQYKPTSLFLPLAGSRSRNGGAQYSVGSHGSYWSSAVASTNSYHLYFDSGSINAANAASRSAALTVRCVAD